MQQAYLARIEPEDENSFLVTFPDIPEAVSGGETRRDALRNAAEALELALLSYTKLGRTWPDAATHSSFDSQGEWVPVPATVIAKTLFIEAFEKSGLTRVAFARKLGKGETEVRRMLDPYHKTKLANLEAGLRALGKRLVISVEEAA